MERKRIISAIAIAAVLAFTAQPALAGISISACFGSSRHGSSHGRVVHGSSHGIGDGVEDGQTVGILLPSFSGRDAPDHFRAVIEAALGVEGPEGAGDALADDLGIRVDEDAHSLRPTFESWV